jgi:hypothetical protein
MGFKNWVLVVVVVVVGKKNRQSVDILNPHL